MTLEGPLLYPANLEVYDGRLMDAEFFHVTYKCHCISGKGVVWETEWRTQLYTTWWTLSKLAEL